MLTFWFVILICLLSALAVSILFIRLTLVVVTIEHMSMSPVLEHGDRVLVFRHWPAKWPRKGHIVLVYPSPSSSRTPRLPSKTDLTPVIKRVVGLPGETLTQYFVSRRKDSTKPALADVYPPWHVPPEHVFVCGDNFTNSVDSRVWGPLPIQNLLGLVVMKLTRPMCSLLISNRNHEVQG